MRNDIIDSEKELLTPNLLARIDSPGTRMDAKAREWLALDTWSPSEAMLLAIGLDPFGTVVDTYEAAPGNVLGCCFSLITSVDGLSWRRTPTAWLFSDRNNDDIVDIEHSSSILVRRIEDSRRNLEVAYLDIHHQWGKRLRKKEIDRPTEYISWCMEKGFTIPWLQWALDDEAFRGKKKPAFKSAAGRGVAAWHDDARAIADQEYEYSLAFRDCPTLQTFSERVAKEMEIQEIYGPRGIPLSPGSIKRMALQGEKWYVPKKRVWNIQRQGNSAPRTKRTK